MALLRLALIHGLKPLHGIPTQQQVSLLCCLKQLSMCSALENQISVKVFVTDAMMALYDFISDDARSQLAQLHAAKMPRDDQAHFLFGTLLSGAGWLALSKSIPAVPSPTAALPVSSQTQGPGQSTGQQDVGQNRGPSTPSPGMLQRSMSQHQTGQPFQAPPAQNLSRMYPPYPQHPQSAQQAQQNKILSQYQRMQAQHNSTSMQYGQLQQFQQMQQMHQMQQIQNLIQQRSSQSPSPALAQHMQRQQQQQQHQQQQSTPNPQTFYSHQAGGPLGQPGRTQPPTKQDTPVVEIKTRPFIPKEWDMLSEIGANATLNETALSLSLFGARHV